MKQRQKELYVADAVQIVADWFVNRSHNNFYWSQTPLWVMQEIVINSTDGKITYNKAAQILAGAETTKLIGNANKGMVYIREQWRKVSK